MATITWLHLSDFHLRAGELREWNQNIVLKSLVEDVQEQMAGEAVS